MRGIITISNLMENLEREEIERELLKEWYKQRTKNQILTNIKTTSYRNN